jgi:integrase
VFISSKKKRYSNPEGMGGNPLTKAHATACKRAGITDFRVHDWRHHWASRMVMSGCDLFTLMKLGGWTTPRMVQRYASVSTEHLSKAISRLA